MSNEQDTLATPKETTYGLDDLMLVMPTEMSNEAFVEQIQNATGAEWAPKGQTFVGPISIERNSSFDLVSKDGTRYYRSSEGKNYLLQQVGDKFYLYDAAKIVLDKTFDFTQVCVMSNDGKSDDWLLAPALEKERDGVKQPNTDFER